MEKLDRLEMIKEVAAKRKRGRPSKQKVVVEEIERDIENGDEDKYGFNRSFDDAGVIGVTQNDIEEEFRNLRTRL